MSQDFRLAWSCPHVTMEEVVSLGSDRRSLDCLQPVANGNTVRIMVNDEFFLPQGGLFTSAVVRATISGPYDILANENTLTLTSPVGAQTFNLTVKRYTAEEVLKFLATAVLTVAEASTENGHLVFADGSTAGPASYIQVTGTAATALGFGSSTSTTVAAQTRQWSARGTQLYPGWRLYVRPDEITNYFPKFNSPVQLNPIFKVTYSVPATRCLRCGNTRIENDYRFDDTGQMILIENENLLYQAALKILLTDQGSNPYYSWYGTTLRSRIGSKAVSGVATLINEDVRKALVKLQSLQASQANYQAVTFKERLYAIEAVNVKPHAQDPTTYLVDVTVRNASSEQVNITIVFTVPGVVALLGSNGLMMGSL